MQDLALGVFELHEVHTGPLLELVPGLLDSIPSLRRVNCITQLGVICELDEGSHQEGTEEIPLSRSLMKILNSTGPNMDP